MPLTNTNFITEFDILTGFNLYFNYFLFLNIFNEEIQYYTTVYISLLYYLYKFMVYLNITYFIETENLLLKVL